MYKKRARPFLALNIRAHVCVCTLSKKRIIDYCIFMRKEEDWKWKKKQVNKVNNNNNNNKANIIVVVVSIPTYLKKKKTAFSPVSLSFSLTRRLGCNLSSGQLPPELILDPDNCRSFMQIEYTYIYTRRQTYLIFSSRIICTYRIQLPNTH